TRTAGPADRCPRGDDGAVPMFLADPRGRPSGRDDPSGWKRIGAGPCPQGPPPRVIPRDLTILRLCILKEIESRNVAFTPHSPLVRPVDGVGIVERGRTDRPPAAPRDPGILVSVARRCRAGGRPAEESRGRAY